MAKKKRKKRAAKRKGSGSQRAKFKQAASTCRVKVSNSGVKAMSREMWKSYGKCMKSEL